MEFTSNKNGMNTRRLMVVAGVGLAALAVVGCKGGGAAPAPAQGTQEVKAPPPPKMDLGADAGVPLAASSDPKRWQNLIAAHRFEPRKDPFALEPIEAGFEARQESERLVVNQGGFSPLIPPPVPVSAPTETYEPQPYRRLAGVLVGDSVLAIIEMGNGRPPEIVRPGQQIKGTDWTVVSIDQDEAVLRRGGNRLPHQIVVRLESKPAVSAPARTSNPTANPNTGRPNGVPAFGPPPGTTGAPSNLPPRRGGGRFGGA